MTQRNTEIRVE